MKSLALLCALLPIITGSPLAGGIKPYTTSLNDPYVTFAMSAINTHFMKAGDNSVRKAVRLVSASKQVVQGTMFRFEIEIEGGAMQERCTVAVWSRPWLGESQRTIVSGEPQCAAVPAALKAADADIIPGGQVSIDHGLKNPNVLFAVNSINKYFAEQGDNDIRTAVRVIKATSQVVAGTVFRYTLEVAGGTQNEVCTVSVWSRPWLGPLTQRLIQDEPDCHPIAPAVGGEVVVSHDLQNPNVVFAVNAINTEFQKQGDNDVRTAVKVIKATSQVVSGAMYRYTLEITGGAQNEICKVSVWDQPWLNQKSITSGPTCSKAPAPAPVGAEVQVNHALGNPNVVFAVNAINSEFQKQGDNDVRTAVKVIKATSQVVAGSLYKYTLEVTGGEQNEICTVSVWTRVWLAPEQQRLVQEGPQCQPKAVPAPSGEIIPGGQMPINHDLQNPNVIFAVNAINSEFQKQGDNDIRTAVKVIKATSQVVQGAMYRYTLEISGGAQEELCTVSVWSRPWLSDSDRMIIKGKPECRPKGGPQNLRVGGEVPFKTDLQNPDVIFAMNGINEMYQKAGDNDVRSAVTLLSATSKVVSGALYTFKLEITGGAQDEVCTVQVWSRPWLSGSEQTKLSGTPSCSPKTAQMLGSEEKIDFTDDEVQEAVTVLELSANSMNNGLSYLKATGATSVTKQVVNGFLYNFKSVAFSKTECTKSEAAASDALGKCPLTDNKAVVTCNASVWFNPRQVPVYQLTDIECN